MRNLRSLSLFAFLLPVGLLTVGCKQKVAGYCDENTPCEQGEYCDLHGEFSASGYIGNTCIPSPFDAGPEGVDAGPVCGSPGTPLRCENNALIECGADGRETSTDCPYGCDQASPACYACSPGTSSCTGDQFTVCDSDGSVVSQQACPLGCNSTGSRCNDVNPSNGLGTYLDQADAGPVVSLSHGITLPRIETDSGNVYDGDNTPVVVPSFMIPAPTNGAAIRVFVVKSFTTDELAVDGTAALAIVSSDDIRVRGLIHMKKAGAVTTPTCVGSPGVSVTGPSSEQYGGDGGSGYRDPGGNGGDVTYAAAGGKGGIAFNNPALVPLRGGCGGWGGAVQLVSRTAIVFDASAGIDANGEGGHAAGGPGSAIGGTSGGGILLEAPQVVLGAGAVLAANGGGGASEAGGEWGKLSTQAAAGGNTCANPNECAAGGAGGTGTIAPGDGSSVTRNTSEALQMGGAGGGSAGYIRINTRSGSYTSDSSSVVSPSANTGTLGIR